MSDEDEIKTAAEEFRTWARSQQSGYVLSQIDTSPTVTKSGTVTDSFHLTGTCDPEAFGDGYLKTRLVRGVSMRLEKITTKAGANPEATVRYYISRSVKCRRKLWSLFKCGVAIAGVLLLLAALVLLAMQVTQNYVHNIGDLPMLVGITGKYGVLFICSTAAAVGVLLLCIRYANSIFCCCRAGQKTKRE